MRQHKRKLEQLEQLHQARQIVPAGSKITDADRQRIARRYLEHTDGMSADEVRTFDERLQRRLDVIGEKMRAYSQR